MIRFLTVLLVAAILPFAALAQTVVTVSPVRARAIISYDDIVLTDGRFAGGFSALTQVAGLEAKVNLYPGRPVRVTDVGPPALLERNQIVVMVYHFGSLSITASGRALDRAAIGQTVRVMNLGSRRTVIGLVLENGSVEVGS